MNLKIVGIGCALLMLPIAAFGASPGPYAEVGVVVMNYIELSGLSMAPVNGRLKGGYRFNPNLAAEVHLLLPLVSDKTTFLGTPFTGKINWGLSLFARGDAPLTDSVAVYGVIGMSTGKASVTSSGGTAAVTDQGVSFGAGAMYHISSTASLGADFTLYMSKDDFDLSAFGVGITKTF